MYKQIFMITYASNGSILQGFNKISISCHCSNSIIVKYFLDISLDIEK